MIGERRRPGDTWAYPSSAVWWRRWLAGHGRHHRSVRARLAASEQATKIWRDAWMRLATEIDNNEGTNR